MPPNPIRLTELQTARLLNILNDWDNLFGDKIRFFMRHCRQTLKAIMNSKAELIAFECPDCFQVFQLFKPIKLEEIVERAHTTH